MKKNAPLIKVLAAIFLAIIAGMLTGPEANIFGIPIVQLYDLVGRLFLNALMLVVVPLVAASIITGAARMGAEESFGTLGVKTLFYFMLNLSLAILVAYTVVTIIAPGVDHISVVENATDATKLKAIEQAGQEGGFAKIEQILFKIVPSNIIAAASQGQMLGLIFFCLLFGYFIPKIETHAASVMLSFWKGVFQLMMKITHLVMKALPIGVFGLVAKVVATSGVESFKSVAWFFLAALIALAIHTFIVLPSLLKFIGGVSPIAHFKAMSPALLTAFSTSSSAATLPVTIDCVEKRAGVSNRICGFTVPLGTSMNLSGSALYICLVVMFITQVYGVELSFATKAVILIMSLLTSLGLAGIPSACLIGVVVTLQMIGLPADAIGLIFAVERILDMLRTVVSVFGNTCCAVLIARSEGEKDILTQIKQEQPAPAA